MNMKKILSAGLALSLSLMMLAGCANETTPATDDVQPTGTTPATESVQPSETTPVEPSESTPAEPSEDVAAEPDPSAPVTQLYYSSDVSEMEGSWTLSQVYAGGSTYDAVENAATFAITFSLDPSELVDEAAYIHNQVYNLTGDLTFGVAAINDALTAEGLDAGYRGSTAWSDFPQGEVVTEGEFYKQPGPATMRFQDVDVCGLFLDQLATGAPADVDTTERSLIIGINNQGQLLLGASEEHLERPGTEGDWTYCLIFDKAA